MNKLESLAVEGKINESASMRDRQSIVINAPIEKVWSILTEINSWPSWYPAIKKSQLDVFEVGAEFTWKIKGNTLRSILRQIDKPHSLTWTGTFKNVKAIHNWRLEAADDYQTIVTTQESLEGIMTIFISHPKFNKSLIEWLECLKREAEK
ncbi:MAG: SRPBCC family protein [Cyclobacteriaceae bacterium]